jgi:beta-galactosidase
MQTCSKQRQSKPRKKAQRLGNDGLLLALLVVVLNCGSAISAEPQPANTAAPDPEASSDAFITDVFSFRFGCHRSQVDLNGVWEFKMDKECIGTVQGWHAGRAAFDRTIKIPGVPQAQGIGTPNTRQKNQFLDPFWVRRRFQMPGVDPGKRVWLRLGGVFPAAAVYLNGDYVGYTKSSRTQLRVDVTRFVKPGAENLVAIKVCDFPKVRLDGMYEWQELSMIWSGVYRPVCLEITDEISLIDEYIQPRLNQSKVDVSFELSHPSPSPLRVVLRVMDGKRSLGSTEAALPAGQIGGSAEVKLGKFTTWYPTHPKLYMMETLIYREGGKQPIDKSGLRFGMREISTTTNKFILNGKPIYVRCMGDMALYLDTIAPPVDINWYLPKLKRAREFGINMGKVCVETWSQDFVEAADEAGIMVIQEMPFGVGPVLRANRYTIDEKFRKFFSKELDGLVKQSRNQASVVSYSMSSELEFGQQTKDSFNFFSRELTSQAKKLAPHALAIDCTGYLDSIKTAKGDRITDFYASIIPTWCKEVLDETVVNNDGQHPSVLHEWNWWSCYPDPNDKPKYKDTQMLPTWFDTLLESARKNGQEEFIPTYRKNSLWVQSLSRKDGLEYARRCPRVEGFILWSWIDFHQYAEGVLDDFWQPKNVSAKEFLKSVGDTVVVLAKEGNRALNLDQVGRLPLAVSHYGEADLTGAVLKWKAVRDKKVFDRGQLKLASVKYGELTQAGDAEVHLPKASKGYKFDLLVTLEKDGKALNANNWSFWAFAEPGPEVTALGQATNAGHVIGDPVFLRLKPASSATIPAATKLVVADRVDQTLADYIQAGGRCLLFTQGAVIEQDKIYYPGMVNFYTLFRALPWNAGPGNAGSVITPHPALADFPCEGMCDLQFVWPIRGVVPMNFEPLRPYGVKPIVRMIDFYKNNANNAHLLEFGVGQGRVLATSFNVLTNLNQKLDVRNLTKSLINYVQGGKFAPTAQVPEAEFVRLFSLRPEPKKSADK